MAAPPAGAAVVGGVTLSDDGSAEAAERPAFDVTADHIADRHAVDPRPIAAQHYLRLRAAEHRTALAAAAKDRAAKRKAAKERAAARKRAARAAERRRLLSMDPRTVARTLLGDYGFSSSQFGCLDSLWQKESGWNPHASNPSSGAYGIP